MKKRYKVDYDKYRNCFDDISEVASDLIVGDESYIENPFISYIIPVYKRADLLSQTLPSVLGQLPAACEWDVVIVDNEAGKENDTERLIRQINDPRILYYRNRENLGVDGNYNRCIELARGEWLAMIHGDDLIANDHLRESLKYIAQAKDDRTVKPAYICQRYIDFADTSEIVLDRTNPDVRRCKNGAEFTHIYNDGKLLRQTQALGAVTGYFAAVPSFGTLMNRRIMIETGGFNVNLGICEDVITPFKLARDYGVYMAPVVMGFHRFDNNESMKTDTIKKIYASMVDFREYMYSCVPWGGVWSFFARDILNKDLRNYCVGLTRFSPKRLTADDFNEIYNPGNPGKIKLAIQGFISRIINKIMGLEDYDGIIEIYAENVRDDIEAALKAGKEILFYGAGRSAKAFIPIFKREYSDAKIAGIVVSGKPEDKSICRIPIVSIRDFEKADRDIAVITTTIIWEYQYEINDTLQKLGFDTVINLLK